jgi:hypothetical protein
MSLLSSLLKIGGIAAAPFTGGASLLATGLGAVGDAASVLGKQQQGAAQGKASQAALQNDHDRNALQLYQDQQAAQNQAAQTDLQRQQFATGNRSTTAKQALIGALLGGGVTPTSLSGGKASGGLLASLNGNPDALAAMKALGSQGSTAQNTPLTFAGGQMVQAPTLTKLPQVDNGGLLSTLASIGQIAGSVSPYIKKKPAEDTYGLPGHIGYEGGD